MQQGMALLILEGSVSLIVRDSEGSTAMVDGPVGCIVLPDRVVGARVSKGFSSLRVPSIPGPLRAWGRLRGAARLFEGVQGCGTLLSLLSFPEHGSSTFRCVCRLTSLWCPFMIVVVAETLLARVCACRESGGIIGSFHSAGSLIEGVDSKSEVEQEENVLAAGGAEGVEEEEEEEHEDEFDEAAMFEVLTEQLHVCMALHSVASLSPTFLADFPTPHAHPSFPSQYFLFMFISPGKKMKIMWNFGHTGR